MGQCHVLSMLILLIGNFRGMKKGLGDFKIIYMFIKWALIYYSIMLTKKTLNDTKELRWFSHLINTCLHDMVFPQNFPLREKYDDLWLCPWNLGFRFSYLEYTLKSKFEPKES